MEFLPDSEDKRMADWRDLANAEMDNTQVGEVNNIIYLYIYNIIIILMMI